MRNELFHHGILGQKWGVRRYQNSDGTYTNEGKIRRRLSRRVSENIKTTDDANRIVRSLSDKEKKLLGASLNEDWVVKEYELETSTNLAKRFIKKIGDMPVSMFEIWDNNSTDGQVAIATNPQYRGQGNAVEVAKKGLQWYEKYGKQRISNLYWIAENSNKNSIYLAERLNFEKLVGNDRPYKDDNYSYYRYKQ